MKLMKIKWAAAAMGALLLAACSSGGGGGHSNVVGVTKTDAAGTQTSFIANSTNSVMSAVTNTTENKTVIQVCADVDKDNDCSKLIIMTIDGIEPNDYSMDTAAGAVTQIVYHDDDLENGVVEHYVSSGGTVKVTGTGAAGQPLKGSYTATLTCSAGCNQDIKLSGYFDVALSQ